MRAAFDAFLGSTKSFDGLVVLVGSGLAVATVGSGSSCLALGAGFERVARAMVWLIWPIEGYCMVCWRV